MKRLLAVLVIILALLFPIVSFGAGTASVTNAQTIKVLGESPRKVLTITWVDDTAGTTLAINPATYAVTGWFLYSAETNPGAPAPTILYDITLIDTDGVDIAGSTLLNRSATITELVNVGTASHGYPLIRGTVTFTLSGNSVNGATATIILTFVAN